MHADFDVVAFILAVCVVLINWGIVKNAVDSLKKGQEEMREDIRGIYASLLNRNNQ